MMLVQPKNIDELKTRLAERPLILFGVGDLGKRILNYCDANDVPVACVVDNNVTEIAGRQVLSAQEMRENYPDANIVISSAIHFDEIKRQAEDMGYRPEQILSYKMFLAEKVTWQDLEKDANWERMRIRVKQISELIDADDTVGDVIDYGAGEMYLKTFLPKKISYYPVDYVRRSDETILCDLNTGTFPDIYADVAVLGGVLEFLTTARSLINHVCKSTKRKIILTYITLDNFPDINGRRASAYVNDFTERQLIDMLEAEGFVLKLQQPDASHNISTLYLFERD